MTETIRYHNQQCFHGKDGKIVQEWEDQCSGHATMLEAIGCGDRRKQIEDKIIEASQPGAEPGLLLVSDPYEAHAAMRYAVNHAAGCKTQRRIIKRTTVTTEEVLETEEAPK